MEEHGYAFSCHEYKEIDEQDHELGVYVSCKERVRKFDMYACCWPGCLTVMYDAHKVGLIQVSDIKKNNDTAMWLKVIRKADCYLLKENLAAMRTKWASLLGKVLLTNSAKWRYDAYRYDEDLKPAKSFLYTIRNGCYGLVKWMKYVERK